MKQFKYLFLAFLLTLSGVLMAAEINDLSNTESANTARFPEGMSPATINDSARSLEAILSRWQKGTNASIIATGSGNAIAVADPRTISSYYDGLLVGFEVTAANTSTVSLNVDSVGAKEITKWHDVSLASGDLEAGQKVLVVYNSDSQKWQFLTPTAATKEADTDTSAVGRQTIWIPAGAWTAATVSGASSETISITEGLAELSVRNFDSTVTSFAFANIAFPKGWDEGTIAARFHWAVSSGSTGTVSWNIQGVALANSDPVTTALGSFVNVDDAASGDKYDILVSDETGDITIGNTPAAEDLVILRIFRDPNDGDDNLADAHARLVGVKIIYLLDSANDD